MIDSVRLSKRLIEITGCSRREAELYIEGGWVSVDGVVIEEPYFKVTDQRVELHPNAVLEPLEPVTLLRNATSGIYTKSHTIALADRWAEDRSEIRPLKNHVTRLTPCIPLLAGAQGLEVLTQDWRVERKLTDDRAKLEQEYVVEVSGTLTPGQLNSLNRGFSFQGISLAPCKVSWQNETRLRFAVKNPLPGQIEFMCASVKLKVQGMKRIRIGGVSMTKVPPGRWRYLAPGERF